MCMGVFKSACRGEADDVGRDVQDAQRRGRQQDDAENGTHAGGRQASGTGARMVPRASRPQGAMAKAARAQRWARLHRASGGVERVQAWGWAWEAGAIAKLGDCREHRGITGSIEELQGALGDLFISLGRADAKAQGA